jgi:hypothetical protein
MSNPITPALTPEQWASRDYRQAAGELDRWAKEGGGQGGEHDTTEYVAKLGLDSQGCVIVMSRAHDRVLVPPPARAALAAFALAGQPFGITSADAAAVQRAARLVQDPELAKRLEALAARLQLLLPADTTES